MARQRWLSLDGVWEFSFDEPCYDRQIVVPFAYQSVASGIGETDRHEVMWYRRNFTLPDRAERESVLLHLGAVDFRAAIWVNGHHVASHVGGYTPISADISHCVEDGRNEIVVQAVDEFRPDQVRGKQTATFPYLVHYTATSGIWQPVWLELTGRAWIRALDVSSGADGRMTVSTEVGGELPASPEFRVRLAASGSVVAETSSKQDAEIDLGPDRVHLWRPADPFLYDLTVELLDADGTVLDSVGSHVGFRTVAIEGGRWFVNGEETYQRLLLDQGYWPDSLMTPPSVDAIRKDIEYVKSAGFDGVRKHQKIEDPRWLHWADRLGILVWAEMPSPFWLGIVEDELETEFRSEWAEAVRRDRNHPSVVCWVPFNESWGIQGVRDDGGLQELVRSVVAGTRGLDPTRPVCDNSGWCHVETDVVDVHDYEQDPGKLVERWSGIGRTSWARSAVSGSPDLGTGFDLPTFLSHVGIEDPESADTETLLALVPSMEVWAEGCEPPPGPPCAVLLSEFGGVGLDLEGDRSRDGRFDYASATDTEDLFDRFRRLVAAAESVPDLSGWCWTQLADVEQERNGLLAADRTPKIPPERLRAFLAELSPRT